VATGVASKVLDLMWSLMDYVTLKLHVGDLGRDIVCRRLVQWLLKYTSPTRSTDSPFELTTSNLTKRLRDGQVLFAILHHFWPSECRPHAERVTGDIAADLAAALADLRVLFGLEKLADVNIMQESRFTIIFLVQLITKVKKCFPDVLCLTDASLDLAPTSVAAIATEAEKELLNVTVLHVNMSSMLFASHSPSPSVSIQGATE
jgi:hypothetical protein